MPSQLRNTLLGKYLNLILSYTFIINQNKGCAMRRKYISKSNKHEEYTLYLSKSSVSLANDANEPFKNVGKLGNHNNIDIPSGFSDIHH